MSTKENLLNYMKNLLIGLVKNKGSDLFITSGFPPAFKINGSMVQVNNQVLIGEETKELIYSIMNEQQKKEFENNLEINFGFSIEDVSRFRINVFQQQRAIGMVARVINTKIPSIEDLNVPRILEGVIMEKRGLIIVVGATGSGKSTTLAAMIGYRNKNEAGHIITIEDPIEFIHEHKKSIVTHREVGVDTLSFEEALKNTLRQAPDVILIGEIRDKKTMEYAIAFAETGHLCLATLHANNANQALSRIINFFPEEKRQQLLMNLSLNLKAVISQRLIPTQTKGRVPAVEVMLSTPYIQELILRGEIDLLKEAIKKGNEVGMQTFDQALFNLYEQNLISYEETMRNADSLTDLKLRIKLSSTRGLPETQNENKTKKLNLQIIE